MGSRCCPRACPGCGQRELLQPQCGLVSRRLLLRQRPGSGVLARGLSGSTACGIFQDQGSNQCPLHCKAGSATGPPGKPGVDTLYDYTAHRSKPPRSRSFSATETASVRSYPYSPIVVLRMVPSSPYEFNKLLLMVRFPHRDETLWLLLVLLLVVPNLLHYEHCHVE